MIWFFVVIFNILVGIAIGGITMYYRDRALLRNQKVLFNELQDSKIKLNEYQKKLHSHFTHNIDLLNRIAKNYQNLYQNMTKSASFFMPNVYSQNNTYDTFRTDQSINSSEDSLLMEAPLDYSDNEKILQEKSCNIK